MKALGRSIEVAEHLRQIVLDRGFIRNKRGLREAIDEIRSQFFGAVAEQDRADTPGAACDQDLAQRASGDGVEKDIG